MFHRAFRAACPALAGLSLLLAACDDPTRPVPVASLELRVAEPFVEVGDTLHLTAVLRDAAGNELAGRPVAWASSAERVATVQGGVVAGKAGGTTTITASLGELRDSVVVTAEGPLSSLHVGYPTPVLAVGASAPVEVVLRDSAGARIPGFPRRWSSSDSSVAAVGSSGKVVGVGPGTVVITAKVGRKSAQDTLEIVRPYTLTFLGTIGDGKARTAGVNDLGQVVGTVLFPDGRREAFFWDGGEMTSLGSGEGLDVNDAGQVVGLSGKAAVMWENGVERVLYTNPDGYAWATAINRHGHVVGASRGGTGCMPGGGCPGTVFLYRDGVAAEIVSATNAEGNGINDDGWVVGAVGRTAFYEYRPFLYRDGTRTPLTSPYIEQCRAPCGSAMDVNNRGEIVGAGAYNPLLYWPEPGTTAVVLPDKHPVRPRINDHGEIVFGTALWRKGEKVEIRYLVPDGWRLIVGTGINNRGQIAGEAYVPDSSVSGVAVLLTPGQ